MPVADGRMRRAQEAAFAEESDYDVGSPHLAHPRLRRWIIHRILAAATDATGRGLPQTSLDIGAGHGSFVAPMLAAGFAVTATEMSRPSIATLEQRFSQDSQFEAVFEQDGSFDALGDRRYSMIACISVLHHIPDYVGAIDTLLDRHLDPGGAFVCFQDPLWYPGLDRMTYVAAKGAYFAWRLTQGNYVRGVRTRIRRLRGRYDETETADLAEYHVVRQGVDQDRLLETLSPRFESVELLPYWSTQGRLWQRLGEWFGRPNTFGIVARDHRGI